MTAVERMPAVSQVSTGPTGRRLRKEAGEAGGGVVRCERTMKSFRWLRSGVPGQDVHGGGVGADGCGVDPWLALLDGVVVEEVTRLKVVGAVEDQTSIPFAGFENVFDVGGDEIGDVGVDGDDLRVEEGDVTPGGFSFGERLRRASAPRRRGIWRCRLEGSTKSRSMRVRVPTPARARSAAVAAPVAPQPMMAACALARRAWPVVPRFRERAIWRE